MWKEGKNEGGKERKEGRAAGTECFVSGERDEKEEMQGEKERR